MYQMKRILGVVVVSSAFILSGCSLSQMIKKANEQNLTVTPSPLEMHADTVEFTMSALLPVNMLKKGKVYTLKTTYKYTDQTVELPDVEFKYEDYPNQKTQQPQVKKTFSFPYQEAMRRGDLVIQGVASSPNGKSKSTPEMPLAIGVITTSEMVQDYHYFAYAAHGFSKEPEIEKINVDFFFEQGRSNLRNSELRSDRGKQFDAYISENNLTKTVTIVGHHSPEGRETINSDLSQDRAEVVKKEYLRRMKKYDYQDMADSIEFVLKPIIQDWSMFKKMLASNENYTKEEKIAINEIIDAGEGTFEEKEKMLQEKMPKLYKKFFDEIYPDLRVAKTEIIQLIPKKTDSEIAALAVLIREGKAPADTLNEEELAYAATLTEDLKEKEQLYRAATKESDSWQAHNNLGVVMLQQSKLENDKEEKMSLIDEAINHFDISLNKKQNPEAYSNKGLAEMMKSENNYKALAMFKEALKNGPKAELTAGVLAMKGVSEIKTAKYDDAVTSFEGANNEPVTVYNGALAQLLKKDFGTAMTSFEEATQADPENALAYYGAAVTAARMGNAEGVNTNLQTAISKDNKLRDRAINDLEFEKFFETDGFKNAVK